MMEQLLTEDEKIKSSIVRTDAYTCSMARGRGSAVIDQVDVSPRRGAVDADVFLQMQEAGLLAPKQAKRLSGQLAGSSPVHRKLVATVAANTGLKQRQTDGGVPEELLDARLAIAQHVLSHHRHLPAAENLHQHLQTARGAVDSLDLDQILGMASLAEGFAAVLDEPQLRGAYDKLLEHDQRHRELATSRGSSPRGHTVLVADGGWLGAAANREAEVSGMYQIDTESVVVTLDTVDNLEAQQYDHTLLHENIHAHQDNQVDRDQFEQWPGTIAEADFILLEGTTDALTNSKLRSVGAFAGLDGAYYVQVITLETAIDHYRKDTRLHDELETLSLLPREERLPYLASKLLGSKDEADLSATAHILEMTQAAIPDLADDETVKTDREAHTRKIREIEPAARRACAAQLQVELTAHDDRRKRKIAYQKRKIAYQEYVDRRIDACRSYTDDGNPFWKTGSMIELEGVSGPVRILGSDLNTDGRRYNVRGHGWVSEDRVKPHVLDFDLWRDQIFS